jgi:hypothetical protein
MNFNYFSLNQDQIKQHKHVWEGLLNKKTFGRPAIAILDTLPDTKDIEKEIIPENQIPIARTSINNEDWVKDIRRQLYMLQVKAASSYRDDSYPSIYITRSVFGQTQMIAEAFGCKLTPQEGDPNLFVPIPWIESASDIDRIKVVPLRNCFYGNSLKFAKFAREATNGQLAVRNPVMTGPIDTANYILGTMRLMEWFYDEPAALHKLLKMITDTLIEFIKEFQNIVGGDYAPEGSSCLPGGFSLCSEVRSLISAEIYEEFEAPYLRQIGKECGIYMIHSCGTWERALPSVMQDPNIVLVNFQCKEMDLKKVIEITKGKLSLSIGISQNLGDKYTWPDRKSFYKYVITNLNESIPCEIIIDNLGDWIEAKNELGEKFAGMFKF